MDRKTSHEVYLEVRARKYAHFSIFAIVTLLHHLALMHSRHSRVQGLHFFSLFALAINYSLSLVGTPNQLTTPISKVPFMIRKKEKNNYIRLEEKAKKKKYF